MANSMFNNIAGSMWNPQNSSSNFDYAAYNQSIYQQIQQPRKITKEELIEKRDQLQRMLDDVNEQLLNFQAECPTMRELQNDETLMKAYEELILIWRLKGGKKNEI